jgi:predicted ABC-type ATPase
VIEKPSFIIIAGPNGSGKSFYSSQKNDALITDFGIKSFDFDLAYSNLFQKFLSIMTLQIENNLSDRVKEIFEEQAEKAIKSKSSFSFQTNFDKSHVDKWRKKFKIAGFTTHLYFLYLDSIELCKKRVAKRVIEGGHYVNDLTIENRYQLGLRNFDSFFRDYDIVNFINTSNSENIQKTLKIEYEKVTFVDKTIGEIINKHKLTNLKTVVQNIGGKF